MYRNLQASHLFPVVKFRKNVLFLYYKAFCVFFFALMCLKL